MSETKFSFLSNFCHTFRSGSQWHAAAQPRQIKSLQHPGSAHGFCQLMQPGSAHQVPCTCCLPNRYHTIFTEPSLPQPHVCNPSHQTLTSELPFLVFCGGEPMCALLYMAPFCTTKGVLGSCCCSCFLVVSFIPLCWRQALCFFRLFLPFS